MKAKKTTATTTTQPRTTTKSNLFGRDNYMWMLIGAALLALGFLLMAGGKSTDPNVFNENEIYSHRRITIAPLLIIAGFVIEIYAIMKRPKEKTN